MSTTVKVTCGRITAVFLLALTTTNVAADYPARPVRVIVSSAPGGSPDVATRMIVAELTRQMGTQFIVDNRPGASGTLAMEIIARAAPDGYTIGWGNSATLVNNRFFIPKLPYDVDLDLQPVVRVTASLNILAVTLSLPVRSVQELIAHARNNPGKLLYVSTGNGTASHLGAELFKRMTSTQMTHVPYKGSQQGISDMIGGQVHLIFDLGSSIGSHVRAGRVRGLAVTTAKRSSAYPELPTVAESGAPNFELVAWGGFIAPRKVSMAIAQRLNAEINKALATSAVKDYLSFNGAVPIGGTADEFSAFIKREVVKWAEVIKGANIKAD